MEGTTTHATDLASRLARLRTKFEEEGSSAGSTKHSTTEGEEKAFKSTVAGDGTTKATDLASRFARLRAKFEEGSGAGSTKHPKTEGEEKAFKSAVAGAGSTEHPKTEGEEKKPYEVDLGFARVRDDPEMPGGLSITLDKRYMYVYAVLGNGLTKRSTTKAAKPAGSRKKRKKLVRLDKECIEMKMMESPPRPYTLLSDDPVLRAMDLEIAAEAQRDIDRYAEMCRQYEIQGYADIEYTDPEDDEDEDRMDWRPWAYLKEVGLAD